MCEYVIHASIIMGWYFIHVAIRFSQFCSCNIYWNVRTPVHLLFVFGKWRHGEFFCLPNEMCNHSGSPTRSNIYLTLLLFLFRKYRKQIQHIDAYLGSRSKYHLFQWSRKQFVLPINDVPYEFENLLLHVILTLYEFGMPLEESIENTTVE